MTEKITLLICSTLVIVNYAIGQSYGTLIDPRDGKQYRTIKIDKFELMADNLNYEGAGICYDFEGLFCSEYGRLYNYMEVSDKKGICPQGWHVPTYSEWKYLLTKLDGKIETTQINFSLHLNNNPLRLQASGYGRTDPYDLDRISFINLSESGFYATSSLRNSILNGKKLTEWAFISFKNNSSTKYPGSNEYKFTYNLGLTSQIFYISCRCMKDYK